MVQSESVLGVLKTTAWGREMVHASLPIRLFLLALSTWTKLSIKFSLYSVNFWNYWAIVAEYADVHL